MLKKIINHTSTLHPKIPPPPDLLHAPFVFLYLGVAAGALLGDKLGQLLRLGVTVHGNDKASQIRPFLHILTAGWLVRLEVDV